MSQRADINNLFSQAIAQIQDGKVYDERALMTLKLEVYESLEWDDAAASTVRELQERGFPTPPWYANE